MLNILGQVFADQGNYQQAMLRLEESLVLNQELKGRQASAWPLGNLATVALAQGEYQPAAALYKESLELRWALRNTAGCAFCLEGLAQVAGAAGQPIQAVRLWGAAESVRTLIGAALSPADQARHDRSVAAAQAQLDEATFTAAWHAGRAMSRDQAVAEALGH